MMIFSAGISFFMMIFSAGISFFMMIFSADISFVISPALVFMRTICCRRLVVVVHETAPEKVLLQLIVIRVDPAHEFA
jgi:hypothetical protein